MEKQIQKLENNGYNLDEEEILLIDDDAYDKSLIGVSTDMRAVYDEEIMVNEFAEHHHCSPEDALDYIEYNVIRALPYQYGKAPIVMNRLE